MFDEHDEEARRIVSEFCNLYEIKHKLPPSGVIPEPRVWLMRAIAMSLKETARKASGIETEEDVAKDISTLEKHEF